MESSRKSESARNESTDIQNNPWGGPWGGLGGGPKKRGGFFPRDPPRHPLKNPPKNPPHRPKNPPLFAILAKKGGFLPDLPDLAKNSARLKFGPFFSL
jgi:hypothetical protein